MTSDITLRRAMAEDIPTLIAFRSEMFRDMGWIDEQRLDTLSPLYSDYLHRHFATGDFLAWVAEDAEGATVGGVGLLWEPVPPTVRNLSGKQAYILGMYVVPSCRRRGIARQLFEQALGHAKAEGAAVISLHASDEGRVLYEQYGFVVSPEMRLFTDPSSASWAPKVAPDHCEADEAD